jgi:predicted dehydrogenase
VVFRKNHRADTGDRNHVAGYRNETLVYGDRGHIHVGHFQENPHSVTVEAFSRDGVIEMRRFTLRDYGESVPVFIKRFGEAYKAELAHFLDCCLHERPFAVTHADGLRAMQVSIAGQKAICSQDDGREIVY